METPPRPARSYRFSLSGRAEGGSLSWVSLQSEASDALQADTFLSVFVVVHFVQTVVEHVISVLQSKRTGSHHRRWAVVAHYPFLLIQEATESSGG